MYDEDREVKRIQKEIRPIFDKLEKDLTKIQKGALSGIQKQADDILDQYAKAETREDKKRLKDRYMALIRSHIGTKAYREYEQRIIDALYDADKTALESIEQHKHKIYQRKYNETGKGLKKALKGYNFKPITEEDAHYADLTKRSINKQKADKWNRIGMRTSMKSGSAMMMGIGAIAALVIGRMIVRNIRMSNETARGMVYDSSSLGVLDSLARTEDEGFEVKKKWIAVLDNRTRDSHADLDGMEIPLDEEFLPGLSRPRDPNAPLEETINCRCKLGYSTGNRGNRTRAAREGIVTGSYKLDSSFTGTRTVTVPNMTYREWQKWRSM